jgi:hypothetical protein
MNLYEELVVNLCGGGHNACDVRAPAVTVGVLRMCCGETPAIPHDNTAFPHFIQEE